MYEVKKIKQVNNFIFGEYVKFVIQKDSIEPLKLQSLMNEGIK